MPIKLLSDELINKIAAGEVIERPFSVVKELVENSIDAKATNITIELKEGGKSMIKVMDDGLGMNKEDAKLCFLRHSTSKIQGEEDLFNIQSLGFRGEALASIASVSNIKIITKQQDNLEATKLLIQAGELLKEEPIGAPNGTTIQVSDLFFNTPARRKYLSVITTELNHIIDVVTRYMLAYPQIGFKLMHNNEVVLTSPKTDMLGNIVNVYGKEIAKDMLKVELNKDVSVNGYISKPSLTRADKSHQSIFINGRYVKNKIITNALYDAYHTLLFNKRHPITVLHVNIKPEFIDVNVHPQKTEIRIKHESMFYDAVYEAVKLSLSENNLIPEVDTEVQIPLIEKIEKQKQEVQKKAIDTSSQTELEMQINLKEIEEDEKIDFKVLGQIQKSFIIAENTDGFLIVDQHAAEERINYEKYMKQFFDEDVKIQSLVSPQNIEFSLTDYNLVKQNLNLIKKLGFELDEFGKNTFLLRTIPIIFHKQQGKDLIFDIVDEIKNQKNKIEDIKEKILVRMACKASIKAGDNMEMKEMQDLLKRLYSTKVPFTCPHGRPVSISYSKEQLEKMFKRKG